MVDIDALLSWAHQHLIWRQSLHRQKVIWWKDYQPE
jgi:hypothetical protein